MALIPDACKDEAPRACDPQRLRTALQHATGRGARIVAPKKGSTWRFSDRFSFEIVDAAGPEEARAGVNDYSIVMLAHLNETTALFTGDMTTRQAQRLRPIEVDVLKLPHHGLDTELSNAWKAKFSVASVEAELWCGRRGAPLRSRFPNSHATGLHGHITLTIDQSVAVSTERTGRCPRPPQRDPVP